MNVHSGARHERIVRNGIFTLMCIVFGAWFAYDGWVGYSAENFEESRLQLPVEDRPKVNVDRVYPTANLDQVGKIAQVLKDATPSARRASLESFIGGPPTYETAKVIYYFGQDGVITVDKTDTRLARDPKLVPAEHTMTSIRTQKGLGVVLGIASVVMLIFLLRVSRTKAEVTDSGLSINGAKPIPFDAMRRFDDSLFRRKGKIDLIYAEGGQEKTVTLDEYHFNFEQFPKIVAAIAEKTGFTDPVAQEKADKARAGAASS